MFALSFYFLGDLIINFLTTLRRQIQATYLGGLLISDRSLIGMMIGSSIGFLGAIVMNHDILTWDTVVGASAVGYATGYAVALWTLVARHFDRRASPRVALELKVELRQPDSPN